MSKEQKDKGVIMSKKYDYLVVGAGLYGAVFAHEGGSIYPAVIAGLQDGSILTNRCPDPRYRQQTLVKEAEA